MVVNLPTELLRSFAAIVDAGSMLRATERVFVTQSALSLQMKRLEDLVRTQLFTRDGRRLRLTPAGHSMLGHAREILAANDRAVMALNGEFRRQSADTQRLDVAALAAAVDAALDGRMATEEPIDEGKTPDELNAANDE